MFVMIANRKIYREKRRARRAETKLAKKGGIPLPVLQSEVEAIAQVAEEPPVPPVVKPQPVRATIEALPPAPAIKPEPIRPTFIEPVLQQRPAQPVKRRPVFDVSARPLHAGPGNFLDLRPNK